MKIKVVYGETYELLRVMNTLKKLDWYAKNGYKPKLPAEVTKNASKKKIKEIISNEYDSLEYKEFSEEIKSAWKNFGKKFQETMEKLSLVNDSSVITVCLTKYGVGGSYHFPDKIMFNIVNKKGIKVLFHEMVHLFIESHIQTHDVQQWEKERIVDLLLHSKQFAFLDYGVWQKNYHGVERYIDPLFKKFFLKNQKTFFERIALVRDN